MSLARKPIAQRFDVWDQRYPRMTGESDANGPIWEANFAWVGALWAVDEPTAIVEARRQRLSRWPAVTQAKAEPDATLPVERTSYRALPA